MAVLSASYSGPDGARLTFRQEMTQVNYMDDLDRNWRYTDKAGHAHYCAYSAADHYPTLRAVRDEDHWCEECGGDYAPLLRYECPLCGEEIRPATTGPGVAWIPALEDWELTETVYGKQAAEDAWLSGRAVSLHSGPRGWSATCVTHLTPEAGRALLASRQGR